MNSIGTNPPRNFRLLCVLVLFLCILSDGAECRADEGFLFKVLASSGACTVRHADKSSDRVHAGVRLFAGDDLVIPPNGYCGLVHSSGRTVEIRKAGTFTSGALVKMVPKGSSGISSRVLKYVSSQMSTTNTPEALSDEHQENMGTTGSVDRLAGGKINVNARAGEATRGTGDSAKVGKLLGALGTLNSKLSSNSSTGPALHGNFPPSTSVIDSVVPFSWVASPGIPLYTVTIVNGRGKPVFQQDFIDTQITVNINSLNLDRENCYYWTVQPKDDHSRLSSEQCLYILSDETAKPVLDTVALIEGDVGGTTSALGQEMLGSLYEEHNMLIRAETAFRSAMQLEPGAAEYRKAYSSFLRRIGMAP